MIKKMCDKCSADEFTGDYCNNCGERFLGLVYAVVEGTDPYFIHAVFDDKETAVGHARSLNALWYPKPAKATIGGTGHVKVVSFELNRYFTMSPVKPGGV